MRFACPACGKEHSFPEECLPKEGVTVACVECGTHILLIPQDSVCGDAPQTMGSASSERGDASQNEGMPSSDRGAVPQKTGALGLGGIGATSQSEMDSASCADEADLGESEASDDFGATAAYPALGSVDMSATAAPSPMDPEEGDETGAPGALPPVEETEGGQASQAKAGEETEGGQASQAKAGEETEGGQASQAKAGEETEGGQASQAKAGEETEGGQASQAKAGEETEGGEKKAAPLLDLPKPAAKSPLLSRSDLSARGPFLQKPAGSMPPFAKSFGELSRKSEFPSVSRPWHTASEPFSKQDAESGSSPSVELKIFGQKGLAALINGEQAEESKKDRADAQKDSVTSQAESSARAAAEASKAIGMDEDFGCGFSSTDRPLSSGSLKIADLVKNAGFGSAPLSELSKIYEDNVAADALQNELESIAQAGDKSAVESAKPAEAESSVSGDMPISLSSIHPAVKSEEQNAQAISDMSTGSIKIDGASSVISNGSTHPDEASSAKSDGSTHPDAASSAKSNGSTHPDNAGSLGTNGSTHLDDVKSNKPFTKFDPQMSIEEAERLQSEVDSESSEEAEETAEPENASVSEAEENAEPADAGAVKASDPLNLAPKILMPESEETKAAKAGEDSASEATKVVNASEKPANDAPKFEPKIFLPAGVESKVDQAGEASASESSKVDHGGVAASLDEKKAEQAGDEKKAGYEPLVIYPGLEKAKEKENDKTDAPSAEVKTEAPQNAEAQAAEEAETKPKPKRKRKPKEPEPVVVPEPVEPQKLFWEATERWTWRDVPKSLSLFKEYKLILACALVFWVGFTLSGVLQWIGACFDKGSSLTLLFDLLSVAPIALSAMIAFGLSGSLFQMRVVDEQDVHLPQAICFVGEQKNKLLAVTGYWYAGFAALIFLTWLVGMIGRLPAVGSILWGLFSPIVLVAGFLMGVVVLAGMLGLPLAIHVMYRENTNARKTFCQMWGLLKQRPRMIALTSICLLASLSLIGLLVIVPMLIVSANWASQAVNAGMGADFFGVMSHMPEGLLSSAFSLLASPVSAAQTADNGYAVGAFFACIGSCLPISLIASLAALLISSVFGGLYCACVEFIKPKPASTEEPAPQNGPNIVIR